MSTNKPNNKETKIAQLRAELLAAREWLTSMKKNNKPKSEEKMDKPFICECGDPDCIWNKYDAISVMSSCPNANNNDMDDEEDSDEDFDDSAEAMSNVIFAPGKTTEDTKVFVNDTDTLIEGLLRATLDYDPEFGFPVLKLEIAAPNIVYDNL